MPEIRKKRKPVYKTGFLLYIMFQGVETLQTAEIRTRQTSGFFMSKI